MMATNNVLKDLQDRQKCGGLYLSDKVISTMALRDAKQRSSEKYKKGCLIALDEKTEFNINEDKKLTLEEKEYIRIGHELSAYLNTIGGEDEIVGENITNALFSISSKENKEKFSSDRMKKLHAIELTNPPRSLVYYSISGPKTLEDIEAEERRISAYTGLPVKINTQKRNNFPRLTTTQMREPVPDRKKYEYGKWYIPPYKWVRKVSEELISKEFLWEEMNKAITNDERHRELRRQSVILAKNIDCLFGAKLFKEYLLRNNIRIPEFLENVKQTSQFTNRHGPPPPISRPGSIASQTRSQGALSSLGSPSKGTLVEAPLQPLRSHSLVAEVTQ